MSVKDIYDSILNFDAEKIIELTKSEIDAGTDTSKIMNEGLIGALDEIGRRFSEGELFIPEMLKAAMIMKSGLEVLKPLLSNTDLKSRGRIVIGTVKGDLHDIGKNIVSMMLEGGGYNVIDCGVDVSGKEFLKQQKKKMQTLLNYRLC